MRRRTLILLLLVLVVGALAVVLVIMNGGLLPGGSPTAEPAGTGLAVEPGEPVPTATPSIRLQTVVVSLIDLPIGERIRRELIRVEQRPDENIALQGGYTFADPDEVVGRITKVPISAGQEILRPMVALNPTDIAASGSDLALYIDQGRVAVAFPIDKYVGVGYALRPGDLIDVMMTLRVVELDPEFNTALPNVTQRVIDSELLAGRAFLFPETTQGRLEFVTDINQVVEFVPSDIFIEGQDFEPGTPIPRRVTQLTIQQAEVLWVGTWRDPREFERAAAAEEEALAAAGEGLLPEAGVAEGGGEIEPTPVPERFENNPDVIILSMLTQDALALKWALERGIEIDLVLRSQGDRTVFVTTSVTLPQIVDQGALAVPEQADFDLHPRIEDVPRPGLPANPPQN